MKKWLLGFFKYFFVCTALVLAGDGINQLIKQKPEVDEFIEEPTPKKKVIRRPASIKAANNFKPRAITQDDQLFPSGDSKNRDDFVPDERGNQAVENESSANVSPSMGSTVSYPSRTMAYQAPPSQSVDERSPESAQTKNSMMVGGLAPADNSPVVTNTPTPTPQSSSGGTSLPQSTPSISVPSFVAGGSSQTVTYLIPSGATGIQLALSTDGGSTYSLIDPLTSTSGSYTWSVPLQDVVSAKLKIVATLGNDTYELESSAFTIDSTAPLAPVITLTSASVTNSSQVTFDLLNCTDSSAVLVSLSTSVPSASASGWQTCNTSGNSFSFSSLSEGAVNFYVFAKDLAGNISAVSAAMNFTYDITAPSASGLGLDSALATNSRTTQFSSSDCSDTPKVFFKTSSTVPNSWDPGWVNCSTISGSLLYTLADADGHQTVYAFTKDAAGNISSTKTFQILLDRVAPVLQKTIINPSLADPNVGDEYAGTIFVDVYFKFNELNVGSSYFVENADAVTSECNMTSPSWTSLSGSGTYQATIGYQLNTGDGVKKICIWGKDGAGNISSMPSNLGTSGVDVDTIIFEIGSPPQVTSFTAYNDADLSYTVSAGQPVKTEWVVQDTQGLSNSPISLEYTTDNTVWNPLLDTGGNPITNYGGLSGFPLNYTGDVLAPAPSSGYFQLRLKAQDKAGNDSIIAFSPAFNTTPWEIYAGSFDTGLGLTATATLLRGNVNSTPGTFAFDPVSGDLYAKDSAGIIKFSVRTGKSSMFLKFGTTNLPSSGVLDNNHRVTSFSTFVISSDGKMYLSYSDNASTTGSGNVRIINLSGLNIESFIGVGPDYTNLTDANNLNWVWASIAIDEENSVYGFLLCSASTTYVYSSSAYKLVKIKSDRTITHIAGDCTRANPFPTGNGPIAPLTSPLGDIMYPAIADIAVKDAGNIITFTYHPGGVFYKIINGQFFKSSLPITVTSRFGWGPDGKLYLTGPGVRVVNLSLTDANDTIASTIIGGDYTLPDCQKDGKTTAQACGVSYFRPGFSKSGQLMFAEGPIINGPRPYRIRYVNSSNEVVTFAGTQAVYGQGFDKSVFRGKISSIDYQKNPNADFTEGLYIGVSEAVSAYYIDAFSNVLSRVAGNELGGGGVSLDGAVIDNTSNLGSIYTAGHDGGLIKFAADGYPYMRMLSGKFYKILSGKIGKLEMNGSTGWDNIAPGSDPFGSYMYTFAGTHNLALKGDGLFLLGVGYLNQTTGITSGNNSSSLRYMDFTNNTVVHIMGGNGTNAYTADVLIDSDLRTLNLNTSYNHSMRNFTHYDPNTDRLYFVENARKLRYITAPGSHSSKLITLIDFEGAGKTIQNFTVRPDSSALFYVRDNGKLYCYNLGTAPAACDNTTSLGPTTGLPGLSYIPNQFTWKDNNVMFATEGNIIMKYNVPF